MANDQYKEKNINKPPIKVWDFLLCFFFFFGKRERLLTGDLWRFFVTGILSKILPSLYHVTPGQNSSRITPASQGVLTVLSSTHLNLISPNQLDSRLLSKNYLFVIFCNIPVTNIFKSWIQRIIRNYNSDGLGFVNAWYRRVWPRGYDLNFNLVY